MKPLHEELKEIRLKCGITLDEIHEKTKIRRDYLERLEEGDFSMTPMPFIRAFLRDYAVIIGIDPDRVTARLEDKISTILNVEPVQIPPEEPLAESHIEPEVPPTAGEYESVNTEVAAAEVEESEAPSGGAAEFPPGLSGEEQPGETREEYPDTEQEREDETASTEPASPEEDAQISLFSQTGAEDETSRPPLDDIPTDAGDERHDPGTAADLDEKRTEGDDHQAEGLVAPPQELTEEQSGLPDTSRTRKPLIIEEPKSDSSFFYVIFIIVMIVILIVLYINK